MTDTIAGKEVYEENIEFWDKAWNMVKVPYTQMPDLDYLPRIPELLQAHKSSPVLDLGCGSGWLSIYLARAGFSVVGVDLACHALELGRVWAEKENLSIDFQVQDISDLNFKPALFGSVVANSIVEHLTLDLAGKTIENLKNLVKPDGIFIGCFDLVGTGPGEYYKLEDGTHVYTDKGRKGMLLRCFSNKEIESLFRNWRIEELSELANGTRFLLARNIC